MTDNWATLDEASDITGMSREWLFLSAFAGRIRARMNGHHEEVWLPDVPRRYTTARASEMDSSSLEHPRGSRRQRAAA